MQDLKVTIIQTNLHWQDVDANLGMFTEKLAGIKEPTDLIVLPEMFPTGFSMDAATHAEQVEGRAWKWMKDIAAEKNCVITGSIIVEDKGKHFNRLVWMRPDGTYETYDKRHLFRMAKEDEHYSAGSKRLIVNLNGWRVCPLICYDLRFPVWSRNLDNYDLLIYVANWPEVRSAPWKTLLQARAIENLSYLAAVNRVGEDGNGFAHSGDSAVIDFKGKVLKTEAHDEFIETTTLSYAAMEKFRSKFPAHLDADQFKIK